jgi:hypothetical protein
MTAVRARSAPARPAPARAPRRVEPSVRSLPQESTGPRLRVAQRIAPELGWRTVLVCCAVGFFATLVASVAIQGERIQTQERADQIAARMEAAQERHRDLRVQVAEAESPGHVLDAARALGMVEPGPLAAVPAAVAATTNAPSTTVPPSTGSSTTASTSPPARLPSPSPGRAG